MRNLGFNIYMLNPEANVIGTNCPIPCSLTDTTIEPQPPKYQNINNKI